jgi:hypothetical protein
MNSDIKNNIIYMCIVLASVIIIAYNIYAISTRGKTTYSKPQISMPNTVLTGPYNMVVSDQNGSLSTIAFPSGIILPWTGVGAAPYGWAVCDGSVSGNVKTPDLRGRFLLGSNPTSNPNTDIMKNGVVMNKNDPGVSLDFSVAADLTPPSSSNDVAYYTIQYIMKL